tara:strand:- start:672 stop:893 length:222 start_codon:yes stop_codon:yes gene_type:complete
MRNGELPWQQLRCTRTGIRDGREMLGFSPMEFTFSHRSVASCGEPTYYKGRVSAVMEAMDNAGAAGSAREPVN